MDQAHVIARSHLQPLVESLVHTMVGFGNKFKGKQRMRGLECFTLDVFLLYCFDLGDTAIGTGTINYDVFYFGIVLRQDALYTVAYGSRTVVARGDDRNFHTLQKSISKQRYAYMRAMRHDIGGKKVQRLFLRDNRTGIGNCDGVFAIVC